ncbi:MAG: glycosyltransferase [Acidobacteriota bacterium]
MLQPVSLSENRTEVVAAPGVSVVICCYNSAARLPKTLVHLAAQQVDADITWEVIVIDNASTDNTAKVAEASWPQDSPAPLRVVYESQQGLSHARRRGFAEAKYEIVSMVDDDNWVCPVWVQVIAELMAEHPEVGACGGINEAVCEITPPGWFEELKGMYAVGPQGQARGDVTISRGLLWGAGMSVRKSAWRQLIDNGFHSLAVDRQGASLLSGGDTELCLALRLAGWHLWFEPRLHLYHFLPQGRLNWVYLRRLYHGSGASTVGHDPYYFAMKQERTGLLKLARRVRESWFWQLIIMLKELLIRPLKLLQSFYSVREGDNAVLDIESRLGRLSALLAKRNTYTQSVQEVRNACWHKNQ